MDGALMGFYRVEFNRLNLVTLNFAIQILDHLLTNSSYTSIWFCIFQEMGKEMWHMLSKFFNLSWKHFQRYFIAGTYLIYNDVVSANIISFLMPFAFFPHLFCTIDFLPVLYHKQ